MHGTGDGPDWAAKRSLIAECGAYRLAPDHPYGVYIAHQPFNVAAGILCASHCICRHTLRGRFIALLLCGGQPVTGNGVTKNERLENLGVGILS